MLKKTTILGFTLGVFTIFQPVAATILTFSDMNLPHVASPVPASYGDNVSATTDGAGSYLEGSGFTPNVTVSYQVFDTITEEFLDDKIVHWNKQGSLTDVLFTESNAHYGEITFTPEKEYTVTLNSFDMIGSFGDKEIESLKILDSNGVVLWDAGVNTIHKSVDTFTPNISFAGAITLRWGRNRGISIDNISFQQRLTVTPPTNECMAEYQDNGSLTIPCVLLPNGDIYKAKMQLITPIESTLKFNLLEAEKK